jgi:hypothetical protein
MFRFSIRELMLVTLVVALVAGWAIDHWRPNNPYLKLEIRAIAMEEGLKLLGYEVQEQPWTAFVIRNKERPWVRNDDQIPGQPLVVSYRQP